MSGWCYRVGNGCDILALKDPCIGSVVGFKPNLHDDAPVDRMDVKVSDFLSRTEGGWDVEKLQRTFDQASTAAILQIQLPVDDQPDQMFWPSDPSGEFSIKSVYHSLAARRGVVTTILRQDEWKALWRLKMHDRL